MPPPPAAPEPASRRNPDSSADQALAAIASMLLQVGYAFTVPAWDGDAYLKISNATDAATDLTITSHGNVTWEYRSSRGTRTVPDGLIVMTISILDPDAARPWPNLPLPSAATPAASHALSGYGFAISRRQPSPDSCTVLSVTNPALPARGTVTITDTSELTWHTRAPHHRDGGLALPDIATSIACTLGRLHHTPSHS